MADRRMISRSLVSSDSFLDLTIQAQMLYFHLIVRADDDGFINNPKALQRMLCSGDNYLQELVDTGYLISFESGVMAIRHWNLHNNIRKDMYHPTVYTEEKNHLGKAEDGSYIYYTEPLRTCNDIVAGTAREGSEGEGYSDEGRKEEERVDHRSSAAPTHVYGELQNIFLTDEEYSKLKKRYPDKADEYIDKVSMYMSSSGKTYKDHYATVLYWIRQDIGKADSKTSESKHEDIDMEELIKRERQSQM